MIIVEHTNKEDITHIVKYEEMDNYIRTKLTPGNYFTIKARQIGDPDKTYKVPAIAK